MSVFALFGNVDVYVPEGVNVDVWRVPRTMRDSSYREILRGLRNRRELPGE